MVKTMFRLGAALGLIGLGTVLYLDLAKDQPAASSTAFETTGHTARDVVKALVALGELETAPANPTSSPARHAISAAERRFGLPADGMADQTLLDNLVAEVKATKTEPATGEGLTGKVYAGIEAINLMLTFIVSITAILGYFGFRPDRTSS